MKATFSALKTGLTRSARLELVSIVSQALGPRASNRDGPPLTPSLEDAHLKVAVAGEPAASSAAFDRINVQEEAGCWCTTVKCIEAEGKAIIFGVMMVVQLSKVFFLVLPAPRDGGCAASSIRRRVHPFRLGPSAHAWSTQ